MPNDAVARNALRRGPHLGVKLVISLGAAALVMIILLIAHFGPSATKSFIVRSNGLIALSRSAMLAMVRERTAQSKELLTDLIQNTTDARHRQLADLPLPLYEGNVERLRRAITQADTDKSKRLQRNVAILGAELERRALRDVDQSLAELAREQTGMGTTLARELTRSYLLLAGSVFTTLVVLLGIGLYRAVINPVRRLRRATQAVTRGDLDVELGVGSGDEVGELSGDFKLMVQQLHESREEVRCKEEQLRELNRDLESEVARQTRHLEQALHDLRSTQRQLVRVEKMASIGTLAGGVAHEFNNLIGGIRGCATEALEAERDPEKRENLEVILRATKRATEITQQLLRFSRPPELRMAPVNLERTLEDSLLLAEPEARKRNVRVVRRIAPVRSLVADADALHQVCLNLFTNALQAMPNGGELTVEATATEREVCITVTDTGIGIPPDQIERIFEPFFTTKSHAPDAASRGAGLGLAVSYSLVEAHGGTIDVESESGRGTRFTVRLPLSPPRRKDAR
ncbi:MAG: ATP-binding protein [Planctomycetota bacterium]